MKAEIKAYSDVDYEPLKELFRSEGDEWKDYLKPGYQQALAGSSTYVAYCQGACGGYVRAILDHGIYVWVIDLLVAPRFRGHGIGRQLLEHVHLSFPETDVYVLSDVDTYYEKLGYVREGSVYKVG
ncbi:GNAT family N-acetyltransferase [Marinoscillum furvescens]|uniref:Acetyltransferase (GNAT) family protein n=1 Tax=Marinoscillum furvescens DSM 4134 TaxID=1122208 RepID=A0A3D9L6C1_MARFU|nr:GNAT family N-acetyltransferase [Marinoscillum furvescens]REE00137.1 acetyltransferase (GNAT) family protein [Marinoscillum furvescens DSM 4134]